MSNFRQNNTGFTLLEMILVISLLGIIVAVTAPIYSIFQTKNDVDLASEILKTSLYRAQVLSRNMTEDDSWGVHIENEDIIIFKGVDYLTSDTAFEEITKMSTRVVVSGTTDIIFNKFTGDPQNTADTELTIDNETKRVTINEKGVQGE